MLIAGALALTVTSATANCIPAKLAGTFNEANYVYIDMGPGVTNQQVVGAFYACGNPNANNGTYAASEWLFVDIGGKLSMQANLGDARVNGCPSGKLVTRLQSSFSGNVRFLTMVATEGAAGTSSAFDYSFGRPPASLISSVPLPRPAVTSWTWVGVPNGIATIVGVISPVADGNTSADACGAVTGYEVVRAVGTAEPGRDPANWTVAQTLPTDGSSVQPFQVTVDCSNRTVDAYLATRLLFPDDQKSDLVSASVRIECNPALAEPAPRIVPKKPRGPALKKPPPEDNP